MLELYSVKSSKNDLINVRTLRFAAESSTKVTRGCDTVHLVLKNRLLVYGLENGLLIGFSARELAVEIQMSY